MRFYYWVICWTSYSDCTPCSRKSWFLLRMILDSSIGRLLPKIVCYWGWSSDLSCCWRFLFWPICYLAMSKEEFSIEFLARLCLSIYLAMSKEEFSIEFLARLSLSLSFWLSRYRPKLSWETRKLCSAKGCCCLVFYVSSINSRIWLLFGTDYKVRLSSLG